LQKEATPGGGRGGKGLTQGKQPTGGRGSDTEPKPNSPLRFLDLTPKILRQPLTLVRMMIVALRLCLVSMETAKQLIIVKSAEFKLMLVRAYGLRLRPISSRPATPIWSGWTMRGGYWTICGR
jgi:hypothetical protein